MASLYWRSAFIVAGVFSTRLAAAAPVEVKRCAELDLDASPTRATLRTCYTRALARDPDAGAKNESVNGRLCVTASSQSKEVATKLADCLIRRLGEEPLPKAPLERAQELSIRGGKALEHGRFGAAERHFAEAITFFEGKPAHEDALASALVLRGLALALSGKSDAAAQEVLRATRLSKLDDGLLELACHVLSEAKQTAKTEELLEARDSKGRTPSWVHARLADMAATRGDFGRAVEEYREALAMSDRDARAKHLLEFASMARQVGKFAEADGAWAEAEASSNAVARFVAAARRAELADFLGNVSGADSALGRAERALSELPSASSSGVAGNALPTNLPSMVAAHVAREATTLAIPVTLGPGQSQGGSQFSGPEDDPATRKALVEQGVLAMAAVRRARGEVATALKLVDGVLADLSGAEALEAVPVRLARAAVLFDGQRWAEAAAEYRLALAEVEGTFGAAHPLTATALAGLAAALSEEKLSEEALPLHVRAVNALQAAFGPRHPALATALHNQATALREKGQLALARKLDERALDLRRELYGDKHSQVAFSWLHLALLDAIEGDAKGAMASMANSDAIWEGVLGALMSVGSEAQRLALARTLERQLGLLISLQTKLLPKDDAACEQALTTVLRRKGRALDAMTEVLGRARGSDPDSVGLGKELLEARRSLALAELGGTGGPSRQAEGARVERLERQLSAQGLIAPTSASLAEVRAALPPETTLVEVVRYTPLTWSKSGTAWAPARYIAYTLAAELPSRWFDLGPAAELDAAALRFQSALAQSAADADAAGAELHRRLWKPLASALPAQGRILFAADGALGLVPLAALPGDGGTRLIDHHEVVVLTTGRDLLRRRARTAAGAKALVIGDPDFDAREKDPLEQPSPGLPGALSGARFGRLPGSLLEARDVAAALEATLLTGADAREAALVGVHGPPVLHIATHGFFLPPAYVEQPSRGALDRGLVLKRNDAATGSTSPLARSGIALAGANLGHADGGRDGLLTALEAASLDLTGTRLVVLSACETGLGEPGPDGVLGLRRSMLLAGAESVVTSLWSVDDEATRKLMTSYFAGLSRGAGRAGALRAAQLELKAAGAPPVHWAAFMIVGDFSTLSGEVLPPSPAPVRKPQPQPVAPGTRGCGCGLAAGTEGHELHAFVGLGILFAARRRRRGLK